MVIKNTTINNTKSVENIKRSAKTGKINRARVLLKRRFVLIKNVLKKGTPQQKIKVFLIPAFSLFLVIALLLLLTRPSEGNNINTLPHGNEVIGVSTVVTTIPSVSTTSSTATSTVGPTPTTIPTTQISGFNIPDSVKTAAKNYDKWVYFPLDKVTGINSSYVPSDLMDMSSFSIRETKSMQLRRYAAMDMKTLFDASDVGGYPLQAISCYRSYSEQESLFNSYVQQNINAGMTQEQAMINANKSSAKAGHSEHQLGTVCDVVSTKDLTLDFTATNTAAWNWLLENSWKYGFVISYPSGKDTITGYEYEPWHIRWVGKEVAADIQKLNYLSSSNNYTTTMYFKQLYGYF